jgi:hypothetical protein
LFHVHRRSCCQMLRAILQKSAAEEGLA